MISAEKIIEKRLRGKAAPPENPKEYEEAKSDFLTQLEDVLNTFGIPEEVELFYKDHSGEGISRLNAKKRSTPEVILENNIAVKVTEDVIATSASNYRTDKYIINANAENTEQFPSSGTIYTAGNVLHGFRKETFAAIENGKKASIEEVLEGIDLVKSLSSDLAMQEDFELASEKPFPQNSPNQ